jgi:hypothetical protein
MLPDLRHEVSPLEAFSDAAFAFALMGLLHWLFGTYSGKKRKAALAAQR